MAGEPAVLSHLVYLDVDDEITSAAARIRATAAEQVTLVLPYGSRLATSRINFRLLAREAAERGKRIEIVCADASARALAMAAGLTVHPSVAAYESARSGAGAGGAGAPDGTGGTGAHPDGDGDGGATATTAATAGIAVPIAAGIEDDAQTQVLTLPRRTSPRVPLVGPPRPPVRTGVAIGVGTAAIALVIVGGLLALELLPSATIVLNPRAQEIGPLSFTVEAREGVAAPDPVGLVVPAQRITFELEARHTVTGTGTKVVETKAVGNVRFSNFDTGRAKQIDAGAIVATEEGIEFATLATVTLPNATIQFPFTIVPSTSTVGVEAVVTGPEGNVGNNTITVVPRGQNRRLLQVTNVEATSGGARTESPEISQEDVDNALVVVDDALAAELDRQVAEGTGVAPGLTVFAQTQRVGTPEYATDPASLVGSPELSVELVATAQGSVLGVDPVPIETIATARLQERVSGGWTLAPGSTDYDPGEPSVLGAIVVYPVTIAATQVRDVDEAALAESIRGLPAADARARLDDFGDVEITLWPEWVTTVPRNAERITLTVGEPHPAPTPAP